MGRIAGLVLLTGLTAACSQAPIPAAGWSPPSELAGLDVTEVRTGAAAQAVVSRLHGGSVSGQEDGVVYYGPGRGGPQATVYVSAFADTGSAADAFRRMDEGIARGGTPFHHRVVNIRSGREVVLTMGLGQTHYYFQDDNRVFWLSAVPERAQDALSELLDAL